jgi:tripartite-type tricarboxylate transporter receptor subunit TctC
MSAVLSFRLAAVAAFLSCLTPLTAKAQDQDAAFYKGKQLKFVIGSAAGGGYDTYGRLLAELLPRHLPGHPTLVPQNMPGASGIRSANYLYEVAPRDGTVIGTFNQSMPQRQVLKRPGVRFDAAKFNWIGAMNKAATIFIVWHGAGVKTLEDAKKREVIMGALSASGGNALFPQLINSQLGTKFKVVTGYIGTGTILLAMERGEVHGLGSMNWNSMQTRKPDWLRDKKVDIILQIGMEKVPALGGVPLLLDLATTPEQKRLFELVSADTQMNWPIVAPPGLPVTRVATLRKAFDAALKDPALKAEALKRNMDVSEPTSGEEVQRLVAAMLDTPDSVVKAYDESIRASFTVRCRDFTDSARCASSKSKKKKKSPAAE